MSKITEKIRAKARAMQRAWYAATNAEELIARGNAGELASHLASLEMRRLKSERDYLARENDRLKARLEDCEPVTARILRRVS